jgi:hypothetical protein
VYGRRQDLVDIYVLWRSKELVLYPVSWEVGRKYYILCEKPWR